MKKILILLTILFSVTLTSTSFASWKNMGEDVSGDKYYVHLERIRSHDEDVYYWVTSDYLKPNDWGNLSSNIYYQGDCKLFRNKVLSISFLKNQMGRGSGDTGTPENEEWNYPRPTSISVSTAVAAITAGDRTPTKLIAWRQSP